MRATIPPLMTLAAAISLAAAASTHAQDRYGPSSQDAGSAAAPATPSRTRFLTWPGKGTPASNAPAQAAQAAPAARMPVTAAGAPVASARPTAGAAHLATPRYKTLADYRAHPTPSPTGSPTASPSAWRPVYSVQQPASNAPTARPSANAPTLAGQPQAAPSSIYAPGPPRPAAYAQTAAQPAAQATPQSSAPAKAPSAQAAQNDEHVHFYSLHRQYGLQPDPAPIPPQFFSSSTADLSQPPGPIPIQRLTSTSGSTTTTRTVRGADGSDSDTVSATTQQ